MGTHLCLFITDARADTHAARLIRLVEALEAWGHVEPDGWSVDLPPRAVEKQPKRRIDEAMNAACLRALLEEVDTTSGLTLRVPSPITVLYLHSSEERLRRESWLSEAERSVLARMGGDLEIDLHKVGRRYFEGAWSSDEVQRVLAAADEARAAGSSHEEERLSDEAGALAERLLEERRVLMVDLFAAMAASFQPAAVKAYLDFEDYIPPRATMAYYRDEAAILADLALLADADAMRTEDGGPAYLRYALCDPDWKAPTPPAAEPQAQRARLRAITAPEVARIAKIMTAWVTPMAGGWLVSNPDFDPVGAPVAPFFEALIAGRPPT